MLDLFFLIDLIFHTFTKYHVNLHDLPTQPFTSIIISISIFFLMFSMVWTWPIMVVYSVTLWRGGLLSLWSALISTIVIPFIIPYVIQIPGFFCGVRPPIIISPISFIITALFVIVIILSAVLGIPPKNSINYLLSAS